MPKRMLLTAVLALSVLGLSASPVNATVGKQALILASSVTGGPASLEASHATAAGYTVVFATDAQWLAMTAADFAQYQVVIVGDPTCQFTSPVVSQNATALATAVMGGAGGNTKAGNRILIGTDPVFHHFSHPGAVTLINDGIDFAGAQGAGATGLYLDTTCGDPDYNGNGTRDVLELLLPKLTIATSNWTENPFPPCGGSVSLISNAGQFSNLHSSDLQGWSCSDHETFPTFPTDWSPLAIATDTPSHPTCGTDVDTGAAVCGESYILISGSGVVTTAPNLSLSPATATNPVGTPHTVTATVTNPSGSPAAGVHVNFVVTGANAGATGVCNPATCNTDSAGHVTFTYTGTNPGDDTIHASITVGGSTQTATAAKTWTAATVDTTKPTCVLKSTFTGPPSGIVIKTQDTGSGLNTITVTSSTNADITIPAFSAGTTSEVDVTAARHNNSLSASVQLSVKDVAGNTTVCDPVVTSTVRSENGQAASQTYNGLAQAESKVTIMNGNPGMQQVVIEVNGTKFHQVNLDAGQVVNLDVASAMKAGSNNTITVTARGKKGASADIIIADS